MSENDGEVPIDGDEQLVDRARSGDTEAFAELWARHSRAGLTAARQFHSIADADDIVAEAYLLILSAVKRGGGPTGAFRPYLYRTIHNVALRWNRTQRTVELDEDADLEDPRAQGETDLLEKTITVRAFRTLPERWQTVLWYTEIEGMEPAEAASLMGLSANSTAALAYRAREGLRKAWLQAHVSETRVPPECRWTTERMGEYTRGGLTPRARARFDAHLEGCTRCSILVEEIDDLSGRLGAFLIPLVLGGSAGSAWLSAIDRPAAATAASGDLQHLVSAGRNGWRTAGITAATVVGLAAASAGALALGGAFAPPTTAPIASADDPAAPAPAPDASEDPAEPEEPDETPAAEGPPQVEPEDPRAPSRQAPPAPVPAPVPAPAPPPPPGEPGPVPPVPAIPVDVVAPLAPVVLSPVEGALTNDATPTFTGTGEPGATVQLAGGSAVAGSDGTWSITPSAALPDGAHSLDATQTDAAGNVSAVASRTIHIDTVAPAPTVAPLPPGDLVLLPDITGTAEPGATVELFDGAGVLLGTTTASDAGAWSIPLPDPERDGTVATAVQTDRAGNVSAASTPTLPMKFERPTLTVEDIAEDGVVTVHIDGIPGRTAMVYIDGMTTGNVHTFADDPLARVTPPLAPGTHTLGIVYSEGDRLGSRYTITVEVQ